MTESDAAPSAPAPEPDPAPIADGVLRQLDPNTIRVERTASWIFSAIVGLFLLIQLITNLFGGPWRIALGLALTIGVGGFLAWLSHRWPEISYRHTFYRVDPQGIEIRRGTPLGPRGLCSAGMRSARWSSTPRAPITRRSSCLD